MKNLLFFLLLPFLSVAQGTAKPAVETAKAVGFTLTGTVQGLADGEAKISTIRENQTVAAGPIKGGAFTLKGSVPEPGLYWISFGSEQPHYLFLENSPIKITGTKADIKNIKIEGSASHKDFEAFEKTFNPLFAGLSAAANDVNKAPESKKPALMTKYNQTLAAMHNEVLKFVKARPNSYVSLFTVSVTMQAAESVMDLDQRFAGLSEVLKNTTGGREIAAYIAQNKIGSIGSEAADFTQNDVNDKPVSLSSFKGKYVLVDFWASWCRPCRMENPNVVKVYNKFKGKNFTVLGVSLDQTKDAWVNAINKDNLTWTHVSDLQFWNNSVAQLYKVQSIPQNFLVDPNGKIIAKDLRGEELEKKLCEYLGCN